MYVTFTLIEQNTSTLLLLCALRCNLNCLNDNNIHASSRKIGKVKNILSPSYRGVANQNDQDNKIQVLPKRIKNKKHSENADTSTSVTFDLDV